MDFTIPPIAVLAVPPARRPLSLIHVGRGFQQWRQMGVKSADRSGFRGTPRTITSGQPRPHEVQGSDIFQIPKHDLALYPLPRQEAAPKLSERDDVLTRGARHNSRTH